MSAQNFFSLASVDHFGFYPAVANQIQYEGIIGLTGKGTAFSLFINFFEGTFLQWRVLSSFVQFNKHLLGAMGSRIEKCCLPKRYL